MKVLFSLEVRGVLDGAVLTFPTSAVFLAYFEVCLSDWLRGAFFANLAVCIEGLFSLARGVLYEVALNTGLNTWFLY